MRLLLELEPGSEPIKGSLAREHGERREFQGWMELAAALEALSEEGAPRQDAVAPPSPGDDGAPGGTA